MDRPSPDVSLAPEPLPSGVDLTLSELQDMASRQQRQIDQQQQLLVAKEQRLKFLKQQELRHQQVAGENERLRRLRERVQQQEAKLKKLRALRGEANDVTASNSSLTSELESIKALFSEKEKELSGAVSKVDLLTRQLHDLRQSPGGAPPHSPEGSTTHSPSAQQELEKLNEELQMRNKLNEQLNSKLAAHREVLAERKQEMSRMDQRIAELQARQRKKRQQEAARAGAAPPGTAPPLPDTAPPAPPAGDHPRSGRVVSVNVAAVEPYIQRGKPDPPGGGAPLTGGSGVDGGQKGFSGGKLDPKYQTLPYSIKFPSLEPDPKKHNGAAPDIYEVGRERPPAKADGGRGQGPTEGEGGGAGEKQTGPAPGVGVGVEKHKQPPSYQSLMGLQPSGRAVGDTRTKAESGPPGPTPTGLPAPGCEGKGAAGEQAPPPTTLSYRPTFTVPSRSSVSIMSNFAPRPYGSSYGGSMSPSRPGDKPPPTDPAAMSISSPAPAGAAHPMTSTPMGEGGGAAAELRHQGASPPGVAPPAPTTTTTTSAASQPMMTLAHGTPIPVASVPGVSAGGGADPSAKVDTSSSSVSSALSVLTTSGAPSVGSAGGAAAAAKPIYRYASKSVIANTYMRKLGSEALDQYRKNMNQMYQSFQPGHVTGDSDKAANQDQSQAASPTARVSPLNYRPESGSASDPTRGGSPPRDLPDGSVISRRADPSLANGPAPYRREMPPYNIDPVKFRPNAPRPLRRRLSSGGESPQAGGPGGRFRSGPQRRDSDDDVFVNQPPPGAGISHVSPDVIRVDASLREDGLPSSPPPPPPSAPASLHPSASPQESAPPPPSAPTGRSVPLALRKKKTNLRTKDSSRPSRRVSFDPLALLLDASLEGELDLVRRTAKEVPDPSLPNDEGITALHNAICAGHFEIVKFLVEFGCNVNAPDSDGWTPLHCAASCNNLAMVKVLVEHGACIFATTISDHETAAEKCEEDEDGYDGCSEYLYNIQEKLGILHNGHVFAVFDYRVQNSDELDFKNGDKMLILRKGDDQEMEWWWAKLGDREGYVPRNLLGLYQRAMPQWLTSDLDQSKLSSPRKTPSQS